MSYLIDIRVRPSKSSPIRFEPFTISFLDKTLVSKLIEDISAVISQQPCKLYLTLNSEENNLMSESMQLSQYLQYPVDYQKGCVVVCAHVQKRPTNPLERTRPAYWAVLLILLCMAVQVLLSLLKDV